ncbi:glycoside hydrolase family 9 protein [Reinekea thalattae]|uniref:cellulase n=1 Tax=Reinekea thalattae TaxID=2593301 RepID=A0A5C8Z692_9GAMM|nr:glycoside hydrolase family 9 protein [Reinekea thalattae]TXR53635.1 glycosyl hydrolase family 5 [Reinekea thalattae]
MNKTFKTTLALAITLAGSATSYAHNFAEALQKSIYFYEAQQSGPLPDWNRVEWRGDSALTDGADVGHDLTGGWFDAGDHVKFGFPMAASATMLAMGVVEYPEAYAGTGQLEHIKNNLRFVADYFIKAHTGENELYGQVGSGSADHAWWGSAEVMPMERPSFKIDTENPGSDLAAETAAALAAISMVFEQDDAAYAAELLSHAEQLYSFADNYRGVYSDAITDASTYYNSWSGYQDEIVWGAIWLYRATGEQSYLDKAIAEYDYLNTEQQTTIKSYRWTQAWDDKGYGSYVLLAKLTGDDEYKADAERWLDYWSDGYNGERVTYTSGGLAYLDQWGAARYAATTSFLALIYSDYLNEVGESLDKADSYYNFAVSQMDYILGNNPMNMSYQIGYGDVYPTSPHHRTAHGSWANSSSNPTDNRHTLIGALVGGPDSDDGFENDRSDYILNEVATDYNAGFTGAVARLWLDFGGEPIAEADFPPAETRDNELYVEAKLNSSGNRFVEIAAITYNHTAWPSRVTDDLKFRYWVDLTEEFAAGYSLSDISVSAAYSQANSISDLIHWSDNLYYVEVDFSGVEIAPISASDSQREVQFRIALPTNTNAAEWDNSADPSWNDAYANGYTLTTSIALYDGNDLVWGQEPSASCGADTGINCAPTAESISAVTAYETPVMVTLSGDDSDGIVSSYALASSPENGSASLSGSSVLYTPDSNFYGTDSFTYTVSDNDGDVSAPATVSIQVEAPIIPAVVISNLSDGDEVEINSSVAVMIDVENAEGANVYLDGVFVSAITGDGTAYVDMPETPTQVVISVVATDAYGTEYSAQQSVMLNVVDEVVVVPVDDISCDLLSVDSWNTGFVLNHVTVTNNGSEAISGWTVTIQFDQAISLVNSWTSVATLSSDGTVLTVNNAVYNGYLAPGASAEFGLQGGHNGSFTTPTCTAQ